jgi:hypothetical protein
MRLRSFGAWSTPRFMIELIPHTFFHIYLTPPQILAPNTTHAPPPTSVFVYGTKNKKPQKNKILYGNIIQYSIGHIIL